jgi:hypothetical protein
VIDPEVRAAIARGPTRVLVELRLPDPAGSAPETVSARAETITAARQAVVAQLAGRTYRVLRQYTTVPLLALEIGPDALQVIEGLDDVVTRVRAERVRPPLAPR